MGREREEGGGGEGEEGEEEEREGEISEEIKIMLVSKTELGTIMD